MRGVVKFYVIICLFGLFQVYFILRLQKLLERTAVVDSNVGSVCVPEPESTTSISVAAQFAAIRNAHYILDQLFYYVTATQQQSPDFNDVVQTHRHTLLDQLEALKNTIIDETERRRRLQRIQYTMLTRLEALQHPNDCSAVKKAICAIPNCGFGCQSFRLSACLMFAYRYKRTVVIDDYGWVYSEDGSAEGGWSKVFHNITNCTFDGIDPEGQPLWMNRSDQHDLEWVEVRPTPTNIYDFMPQKLPAEFAQDLLQLLQDPSPWWLGVFNSYLVRPKVKLVSHSTQPSLGLHIRRSDKIGQFITGILVKQHAISDYMRHVEDYFKSHPAMPRTVYLATDDPSVVQEILSNASYSTYHFIYNASAAALAVDMTDRESEVSLAGLLNDVFSLASCDFIVCTLSSNMCRLAYQLMQVSHGGRDMSTQIRSLDKHYYVDTPNRNPTVEAWTDHSAEGELSFAAGDEIAVMETGWDGYSKGEKNGRSKGRFPSYKAFPKYRTANFHYND